jgi:hypothetical protein
MSVEKLMHILNSVNFLYSLNSDSKRQAGVLRVTFPCLPIAKNHFWVSDLRHALFISR